MRVSCGGTSYLACVQAASKAFDQASAKAKAEVEAKKAKAAQESAAKAAKAAQESKKKAADLEAKRSKLKAQISEEFGGDPHDCYSELFKEECYQNVVQWIAMRSDDEEQIAKFKRIADRVVSGQAGALAKVSMAAMAGSHQRKKAKNAKVAADIESGAPSQVTPAVNDAIAVQEL